MYSASIREFRKAIIWLAFLYMGFISISMASGADQGAKPSAPVIAENAFSKQLADTLLDASGDRLVKLWLSARNDMTTLFEGFALERGILPWIQVVARDFPLVAERFRSLAPESHSAIQQDFSPLVKVSCLAPGRGMDPFYQWKCADNARTNELLEIGRWAFFRGYFSQARDCFTSEGVSELMTSMDDSIFELIRPLDQLTAWLRTRVPDWLALGDYASARAGAEITIWLSPGSSWAYLWMAEADMAQGRHHQAIARASQYRTGKYTQWDPRAVSIEVSARRALGDLPGALGVLDSWKPIELALARAAGIEKGDSATKNVVDSGPEGTENLDYGEYLPALLLARGEILNDLGRPLQALPSLELSLSMSKTQQELANLTLQACLLLGKGHLQLKHSLQALEYLDQAKDLGAAPEDFLFSRARAALAAGQPARALSDLRDLRHTTADSAQARLLTAELLLTPGKRFDPEEAVLHLERALEQLGSAPKKASDSLESNDMVRAWLGLAMARHLLSDRKGALEALDRARKLSPGARAIEKVSAVIGK